MHRGQALHWNFNVLRSFLEQPTNEAPEPRRGRERERERERIYETQSPSLSQDFLTVVGNEGNAECRGLAPMVVRDWFQSASNPLVSGNTKPPRLMQGMPGSATSRTSGLILLPPRLCFSGFSGFSYQFRWYRLIGPPKVLRSAREHG